jgi:alkanesulfonate monooxygenase SsuD/methylene tetrahydromethanopterin reductase-like flavin-dependent oxidoreductase (luciferase family)
MRVEFGLALPAGPPKGALERFIGDLDTSLPLLGEHIRSLWMTDHFFWDDEPTHEAWTVMAFLAARYPALEIGPMVLGQSYRNPALLAKMAATLQVLSGGRFIMGIGAGWKEDEYHAYGYPFPGPAVRIGQLEDTLEIMTRLWRQPGRVSYAGAHYQVVNAYCEPKPEKAIPIIVGGGGAKTMMLAARFADMWNLPDAPYDQYTARMAVLRQHCESIGRGWDTIRKSWFGRVAVGRTAAEAEARGGGRWRRDNAFVGTPAELVEQMSAFAAAGCSYFMIDILGLPDADVIGMMVEDVFPKVR